VFAADEPTVLGLPTWTKSDFTHDNIPPRVLSSIRAYDNGKAFRFQKITCEQLKLITLHAFVSRSDFLEIQSWHGIPIH